MSLPVTTFGRMTPSTGSNGCPDFRTPAISFCQRAAKVTAQLLVGVYTATLIGCAGNSHPITMKMGVGKITDEEGKDKQVKTNICRQENARWGNTIISKCHVETKPNGEETLVLDDSLIAIDGEVRGGVQLLTGGVIAGSTAVGAAALLKAANNTSSTNVSVKNSGNNTSTSNASSSSASNAASNAASAAIIGNGNRMGVNQGNLQLTP